MDSANFGLNVDFSNVITRFGVMRLVELLDDVPRPLLGQSEAGVVVVPRTCRMSGLMQEGVWPPAAGWGLKVGFPSPCELRIYLGSSYLEMAFQRT